MGVYSGQYNLLSYPNGDQAAVVSIVLACEIVGGKLNADNNETLELKFFPFTKLPESLASQHRIRIEHAYTRPEPYLGID